MVQSCSFLFHDKYAEVCYTIGLKMYPVFKVSCSVEVTEYALEQNALALGFNVATRRNHEENF